MKNNTIIVLGILITGVIINVVIFSSKLETENSVSMGDQVKTAENLPTLDTKNIATSNTVEQKTLQNKVTQAEQETKPPVIQKSDKRGDCEKLLNSFKLKVYDSKTLATEYYPVVYSDFLIGYSPSLNICVGGYELQIISSFSGDSKISYWIVNPLTNKWIDWEGQHTYENYRKTLNELTEGQISKAEGLVPSKIVNTVFCKDEYYRCSVNSKLVCSGDAMPSCQFNQ